MAEPLLQVEGLSKRFGGIVASDALSLEVTRGELHAVIGPNGAGKTTLIGQLTGLLLPDSGTIRFGGEDITALAAYQRSLLGLARSPCRRTKPPRFISGATREKSRHCASQRAPRWLASAWPGAPTCRPPR